MTPQDNLAALAANPYPGRLIIAGLNESGQDLVQVYAIMGRSENSRNRVFEHDAAAGIVRTAAADPAKVKDPSLIIYEAMAEDDEGFVVSNGAHTLPLLKQGTRGMFEEFEYEPDGPNFTPRIAAACEISAGQHSVTMFMLRKSPWDMSSQSSIWHYEQLPPGIGMCIHTYIGDGNPLPSFQGEPYPMPLVGNAQDIARMYWDVLNGENRVALVVKTIEVATLRSAVHIVNKYDKVAAAA